VNADDKKILRKFIIARADRTKALLQRELNRKLETVPTEIPIANIRDATTMMAIEQFNRVLSELADEANELVKAGLYPLVTGRRGYMYNSQPATIPEPYTDKTICDHLRPFDKIQGTIPRLEVLVEDDKKLLKADHAKAVRALDNTVDDALIDMISQDLPGVRETLQKLTDAFDKVLLDYGADPTDAD
jgi:hypothetical protein